MKKPLILVLVAIGLVPVVVYFNQFHGPLAAEHGRWGEFGSYLSGVYGSLALIILTYTTCLTRNQFRRQNEDSVFFKLFESLQNRIQQSTIKVGDSEFPAHKSLKYIAEKFYFELSAESVEIARMLLCEMPEAVSITHYSKIFKALNGPHFLEPLGEDRDAFIADITAQKNFNERWERLKTYIGSRGEESEKIREALRATGSANFYKIPYRKRQRHYANALQQIMRDHGEFLDGYFRNLLCVVQHTEKASSKDLYVNFINAQLTRYEIVIIFYMIAGGKESIPGTISVNKLGLLNRLQTIDCQSLMIDCPGDEEIERELRSVFKFEGAQSLSP